MISGNAIGCINSEIRLQRRQQGGCDIVVVSAVSNFRSGNVILPKHDGTFLILGASNGRMGL
ncbi:hypothetical protein A8H26_13375 [Pluralibacter gergoviae]|nr:hypothetical protein A8H26_13375 [Pluralibacter gergoviae]